MVEGRWWWTVMNWCEAADVLLMMASVDGTEVVERWDASSSLRSTPLATSLLRTLSLCLGRSVHCIKNGNLSEPLTAEDVFACLD